MPRTIAIGDIHGCLLALDTVLNAIESGPDDTLVVLGDFINRGPSTRGVLDRLITLERQCQLVSILGNHDQVLLEVLDGHASPYHFLAMGGAATLASYDAGELELDAIPAEHVDFLRRCRDSYETDTHLFLHAQYIASLPLEDQPSYALRWEKLRDVVPGPHFSGKRAVVGHSSQKSGEVLDLGHIICIDTYCYGGGWLTALEIGSGLLWQADRKGKRRR